MTFRAAIFCKIDHTAMVSVLEAFKAIPEIKKVFSLTGDYDVLAEIEVKDTEELYEVFARSVDCIPGIINTNTHVIMKSWEK